jgi:hypothetical protein
MTGICAICDVVRRVKRDGELRAPYVVPLCDECADGMRATEWLFDFLRGVHETPVRPN